MWRLTKPQMKAEGGRRKTNKQTLEQRERLWSLVSLSVTLYPFNRASTRALTDKVITHTHVRTHTHTVYVHFPNPLSPHFETLKMRLSKGSAPDSLLQPSRRMQRTDRLIVRRVAATTKQIKSLTDWQTYMVHSDSQHLHCLVHAGLRLSGAWILHICLVHQSDGPGSTRYQNMGMCVSV